jgi:hypothetical protein
MAGAPCLWRLGSRWVGATSYGDSHEATLVDDRLAIKPAQRAAAKLPQALAARLSPDHAYYVTHVFEEEAGWLVMFDPGEFGGGVEWLEVWRDHDHFTSHVVARYDSEPVAWIPLAGGFLVATWEVIWQTKMDGTNTLASRLPDVTWYPRITITSAPWAIARHDPLPPTHRKPNNDGPWSLLRTREDSNFRPSDS